MWQERWGRRTGGGAARTTLVQLCRQIWATVDTTRCSPGGVLPSYVQVIPVFGEAPGGREVAGELSPSSRPLPRLRFQGRNLFYQTHCFRDGPVQLWVGLVAIVLRRNVDLDIGIGTIVLNIPAYILKPDRGFGLRCHAAINKPVTGVDTNHTSPGTLAN